MVSQKGSNIVDRPIKNFQNTFSFPDSSQYAGCLQWGNDTDGPYLEFLMQESGSYSYYKFRDDGTVLVSTSDLDDIRVDWNTGLGQEAALSQTKATFDRAHVEFIKTELINRRYHIENAPVEPWNYGGRGVDPDVHARLLALLDKTVGTFVLKASIPLTQECLIPGIFTYDSKSTSVKIDVGNAEQPYAYRLFADGRLSVEHQDSSRSCDLVDAVRHMNISPVETKFIFDTLRVMRPIVEADMASKVESSDFVASSATEIMAIIDNVLTIEPIVVKQNALPPITGHREVSKY